jgi:hypothetical protein
MFLSVRHYLVISVSDYLVMHSALTKLQKGFGNNKQALDGRVYENDGNGIDRNRLEIHGKMDIFIYVNVDVSSTEAECLLKYVRLMKLDESGRNISLVPPPNDRNAMEKWIFNLKTLDKKVKRSRLPLLTVNHKQPSHEPNLKKTSLWLDQSHSLLFLSTSPCTTNLIFMIRTIGVLDPMTAAPLMAAASFLHLQGWITDSHSWTHVTPASQRESYSED